jgi:hypothetical protein
MSAAERIIAQRDKKIEFLNKIEIFRSALSGDDIPERRTFVIKEMISLLEKTYRDFVEARLAAGLAAGALKGVAASISSYQKNPVDDVLIHAKFFAENQAVLIKESVEELG